MTGARRGSGVDPTMTSSGTSSGRTGVPNTAPSGPSSGQPTGAHGRRALVVDDSPEFARLVSELLRREGFEVEACADGETGVDSAKALLPDLVILDLTLPGIDGIEACRRMRTFSDAYIVMLTGRTEEVDLLVGLAVGADDYVTKPFSPRELIARIRTMLRRPHIGVRTTASEAPASITREHASDVRRFGTLTVDPVAREVAVEGRAVHLTKTEFDLLEILTSNPRSTFSRETLLQRVWGTSWYGDDHVVDVHVANLRRKLGDVPTKPRFVRTVRGVGYRLVEG